MRNDTLNVVIVGGGSAGWLTAGILAAEHGSHENGKVHITLVESPDVNPVGVGEGTWPTMRDTLRRMGVSESDFIRECDASFKQASCFVGWVTGMPGDHYFHPFSTPAGYGQVNVEPHWRQHHRRQSYADAASFQPRLCEAGKAPKQATTPEFAAVANYAYHLDAGKFGQFLQKHCVEKLGVTHVLDHVGNIIAAENGDIRAVTTRHHGDIEADLYIDCTGFASLLLGGHYGVPMVSRRHQLFCDTAIAVQVPYDSDSDPIASHTISTAQKAGWIWDIGLPTRRGLGYVYSSSHTDEDEAVMALQRYIGRRGDDGPELSFRKIGINPGHREVFWKGNCVAVGISAGFIEPLEASALALIEMSAGVIRDELPGLKENMPWVAQRYNERFGYRWSRIIDFLKLHYLLSRRSDSDFWLDNRRQETIPERLIQLMRLWRQRPPSRVDFHEIEEIFPSPSYHYVLYGMGFEPENPAGSCRSDNARFAEQMLQENASKTRQFLAALPANRELLDHIAEHGLPRS